MYRSIQIVRIILASPSWTRCISSGYSHSVSSQLPRCSQACVTLRRITFIVGRSTIATAVTGPLLPHYWNPYISIYSTQIQQIFMNASTQGLGTHIGIPRLGTWSRRDRIMHINCLKLKAVSLGPTVTGLPGHDCYKQYQGSVLYPQAEEELGPTAYFI